MLINPSLTKMFRLIFLVKIGVAVIVILLAKNLLQLGDRPTVAAPDAEASSQEASPPPPGEAGSANAKQGLAAADSKGAGNAGSGKRQGFLEGLLTMPSLETEGQKKDEIGRYLGLAERAKQQVDDRLRVLEQRADQLQKLEKTIDEKLRLLDEERKYFATTVQREKEIAEERLTTLVDLYANMEPKKAAPVFETMDKDLVVALFKKLKNKQVTRILEAMTPERSVKMTEYFGRIGSAKEYDLLKEMNSSLKEAFKDCKGLPKGA